jgi:hypothetical protein
VRQPAIAVQCPVLLARIHFIAAPAWAHEANRTKRLLAKPGAGRSSSQPLQFGTPATS